MEERILGTEDMIEEIDVLVKETFKSEKNSDTNYPGNLGHYAKTKPKKK